MQPALVSVIHLEVTHVSREMDDVIFTWGGPHGAFQVRLTTLILLLDGYIGWLWHIHFWAHRAATSFHLDGLGTG